MLLNQHIKEYDPPIILSFVKKWKEYDDVYSFLFKPETKIEFLSGQNTRIVIPGLPEEVAAHSLSIASPPNDTELMYSMYINSGSPFKKAMLSLKEDDIVRLVKVKGETFLPKDKTRPVVLIAGGIGITPFRSIMVDVIHRELGTKVVLVHVARGEYLYQKELQVLPHEQHYIRRTNIESKLKEITEQYLEAMYFVAGPPPFIANVQQTLLNFDVSEFAMRASKFTGYQKRFE